MNRHEELEEFKLLARKISRIAAALLSGEYRRKHIVLDAMTDGDNEQDSNIDSGAGSDFERARKRPYFEVLIVDNLSQSQMDAQRSALAAMRRDEDPFTYAPVFVSSLDDALIAVSFNHAIQSVIIRFGFGLHSENDLPVLNKYLHQAHYDHIEDMDSSDYGLVLAQLLF